MNLNMELEDLLNEGEEIYAVIRETGYPIHVIGPNVTDPERYLDLGGCIEYTLHLLLENGANDDEIWEILAAEKKGDKEPGDDYEIDLGYIIPAFYPTAVIATGIVYERPANTFVTQVEIRIPDDPSDDEILEAAARKLGINPDEYIVKESDQVYTLESLVDEQPCFVLIKKNDQCLVGETKDVTDISLQTLKEIAYELYKIDWVHEHVSAEFQLAEYRAYALEKLENPEELGAYSFEDYLWERGYGGSIYACFNEFCEFEFNDSEYMQHLLGNSVFWKKYQEVSHG